MSGTDSTSDAFRTDGGATTSYYLWGLFTTGIAWVVTHYLIVQFQDVARNIGALQGIAVALTAFWVLLLFVLAIVGAMVEDRMATYGPKHADSWAWAGRGAVVAVTIVGAGTVATWLGLEFPTVAPELAETPYLSGVVLAVTGGTGYIYTTSDDDTDPDREPDSTSNSDESDESLSSDEVDPAESGKRQPDPTPSNADQVWSSSGGNAANNSTGSDGNYGDDTTQFEFDWQRKTGVSMDDVGGMKDVKRQLWQLILRPLKTDRKRADALDISAPNILFYGPPGTGKTFLARALATELGLPFVSLSGSDVTSKWINESAQRIDRLFAEAKALSAAEGGALIFLDEIDAVLSERSSDSHEETRKVVNEFLAQLQDTDEHDIVFLAATNCRESLDKAATRNGRIDREIEIGLPDLEGRLGILRAQLQSRQHDLSNEELLDVANRTGGQSAADLQTLVEDAARHAAFERNDDQIVTEDF